MQNDIIPAHEFRTKNFILEYKSNDVIEKHLNELQYEVGHICVGNEYKEIAKIFYSVDCFNRFGGHCRLVDVIKDDNEEIPIIFISKFFYDCWFKSNNDKMLSSAFLHEYGHFINGDFRDREVMRNSDKIRVQCVKKGILDDHEKKADEFAAKEIGKAAMMTCLDKMISIRKKRNDAGMEVAIKEFELRKKALQKLKF